MNYKIVTDSSADVLSLEGVPFCSVPLKIVTSEREYVDTAGLDVSAMLADLKAYKGRSGSSCPNPEDYLAAFGDSENVFCITITSGLSGSCNSANAAARAYTELHPERHVHVIDSLSTGPECRLIIEKLRELILIDKSFDEIVSEVAEYQKRTHLIFALESLHNLANNGRVNPIVAKISGFLGIRVVGKASDEGKLEITNKTRGAQGAISSIIKNMLSEGYIGGRVIIHHAEGESTANMLRDKILLQFPDAEVSVDKARGLCSFYAEPGGLLVGFES